MRILLTFVVLFFLIHSTRAQDSAKVVGHIHKTHTTDAVKSSRLNSVPPVHKTKPAVMPTYPRDGYIAIMGGLGNPTGPFATNEGAKGGSVFSISAAFPGIISHCGIAFKFDDGTNGFNQGQLVNSLNVKTGFANISCSLPDQLGHCSFKTFLTGLYLTYPKKHFTIDIRALMGVMTATIPGLTVNYYNQTAENNGNYYQSEASGSAFAIDFGFEVRYPVRPRLSLIFGVDYLHGTPSFPIVTTGATLTSNGSILQGNESGQEVTIDQPFNLLNLSLGVGYTISAQKRGAYDGITPSYK